MVIRFNSPETPRVHATDFGFINNQCGIDNKFVSDSLISQAVALGSDSYSDGNTAQMAANQ
jgi:hypothetical protein